MQEPYIVIGVYNKLVRLVICLLFYYYNLAKDLMILSSNHVLGQALRLSHILMIFNLGICLYS